MFVDRLRIHNLRCIRSADLSPGPGLNVLVGDNASGKTSVLEGLFLLSRGQTFRVGNARSVIRQGELETTVQADVRARSGRVSRIGLTRTTHDSRFRINGENARRMADLATALPVQAIDPNVHRLLEEGPNHRRKFLDWGVFHVEHDFYRAWRRYMQSLRQRNAAIKKRGPKSSIVVWDQPLVESAERVNAFRQQYVGALSRLVRSHVRDILGDVDLDIRFQTGWPINQSLGETLARNLTGDMSLGFTQAGPHRADLKFRFAGRAARDFVSRGQQKVITVGMLLAQADLLRARRDISPVLLVDDIAAELGPAYREQLLWKLAESEAQVFLTFLESTDVLPAHASDQLRMFHVEHGVVHQRN